MTEEEARAWIRTRFGDAITARLETFVDRLSAENEQQNLIARSSLSSVWARHVVDSAQLVDLAPAEGLWIDIGTGGGFPGLVVALVRDEPIVLVEPRRQRAVFLADTAAALQLAHVKVLQAKIGGIAGHKAQVISARAVASIDALFRESQAVSNQKTIFVFPRGRSGKDELSRIKRDWKGVFHVKQSITDADAAIIVANGVRKL